MADFVEGGLVGSKEWRRRVAAASFTGRIFRNPAPAERGVQSPRRGGSTPLRDLSHGSQPSHGPGVIVEPAHPAAKVALASLPALFAQGVWPMVSADPSLLSLLLGRL